MANKVLIFSAPSGSGKSTIVHHLMEHRSDLEFSVSATSREPRGEEKNGVDYYFISEEVFREKIACGDFVEHEEVYPGRFYGTLKEEVERIWAKGSAIIFDVDVKGGINLKNYFKDRALSIFIQAPSIEELEKRLVARATDSPEAIKERLAKAEEEMGYAGKFDRILINDDLQAAFDEADKIVDDFLI